MKLIGIWKAKKGSITMMSVGMLPIFLLVAGIILFILMFWTSYARLLTAAEAGALTATKYMEEGAMSDRSVDNTVFTIEEATSGSVVLPQNRLAKRVQHIVVSNGGGPHGQIICTHHTVKVIASLQVMDHWIIYAAGQGPKGEANCNWRKISY